MTEVYWVEQDEAELPENDDWLSEKEKDCLAGLRFAKRRADWKLGRWTAKYAVAAVLNVADDFAFLRKIEIRPAASGAPEVFLDSQQAPVSISLSHRLKRAISAVGSGDMALGCDIELIEPHSDVFVSDYFTAEEQQFIADTPAPDRPASLALLWSAKESALKALRTGLRLDTRAVTVSIEEASATGKQNKIAVWHRLHVRHRHSRIFQGWWRLADGLVYTIVAEPAPSVPVALAPNHEEPCHQSHQTEARLSIFENGQSSCPVLSREFSRHLR